MDAAVVMSFDHPPRYACVERPEPGEGQVVVDVLAAALSPRVRSGASGQHYSARPVLPMVPGIDAVGRLADGRLVYVLALDAVLGTMAEQVVVGADQVVALPDGIDPSTAAAAAVPGISSWIALRSRIRIEAGQEVLVLGATGVAGRMAVQIAKTLGAGRVVAAGRDPERLAGLASAGADDVVPLHDHAALAAKAATVDVVLDYVWGTVTEQVLPAVVRGRARAEQPLSWISIGSTAGPEITLPSAALRAADLRILGTGQGSLAPSALLAHVPALMAAVADGRVHVAVDEVPLAEVEATWTAPEHPGRRTVFTPR